MPCRLVREYQAGLSAESAGHVCYHLGGAVHSRVLEKEVMKNSYRIFTWVLGCALITGCYTPPDGLARTDRSAVIVGQLVASADGAKLLAPLDGECPDVAVTINGTPATLRFDSDCAFVIDDVEPAETLEVRVELASLGVVGIVELSDVGEGELIEISVEPGGDSLTVKVERRTTPEPADSLPTTIDGNNVSILLSAGVFAQDLTVLGNKFTLTGEAGDGCDDTDNWTVIDGAVILNGNKATFRNILFLGPVEIHGNSARFINCCFDDQLVIFGNNASVNGDDDDNDDDDEDDDEDDDD